MQRIPGAHPPQWDHNGWTVTLDPTSGHSSPHYWLADRHGADGGTCDSLPAARAAIDAERPR